MSRLSSLSLCLANHLKSAWVLLLYHMVDLYHIAFTTTHSSISTIGIDFPQKVSLTALAIWRISVLWPILLSLIDHAKSAWVSNNRVVSLRISFDWCREKFNMQHWSVGVQALFGLSLISIIFYFWDTLFSHINMFCSVVACYQFNSNNMDSNTYLCLTIIGLWCSTYFDSSRSLILIIY